MANIGEMTNTEAGAAVRVTAGGKITDIGMHTTDANGNAALRIVNEDGTMGGGSGPTAAVAVSFNPAGLKVLKGTNVQTTLGEVDAALADLQDSASILQTNVTLANTIGADTVVMLDELTAFEIDGRPNYKEPGATVYGPNGSQGIIHTVDAENQSATIKTTVVSQVQQTSVSTDSSSDYGMRGDYCSQFGVIEANAGYPKIGTGNSIVLPGAIVAKMAGTEANPAITRTTLASPETVNLSKTVDSLLIYVRGLDEYLQCEKICFKPTKPEDDQSTCSFWWNGKEMKFRDINHGDVWTPCQAAILADLHYTNGVLTWIDFTGWYHILPVTE